MGYSTKLKFLRVTELNREHLLSAFSHTFGSFSKSISSSTSSSSHLPVILHTVIIMAIEMIPKPMNLDSGVNRKSGDAHRSFLVTQILLRTLVIAFSMAGIVISVTARESVSLFGLVLDARYNYSSAMRFQVGANVVVCAFCFFVWVILLRMFTIPNSKPKFNSHNSFHLLLHDLVMTTLSVSGCAAGTTVGYLGKYGEKHSGWTPVCDYVNKFCNMQGVALGFSYLAFTVLFLLTVIDAFKLNSHTTHRIAGDT